MEAKIMKITIIYTCETMPLPLQNFRKQ